MNSAKDRQIYEQRCSALNSFGISTGFDARPISSFYFEIFYSRDEDKRSKVLKIDLVWKISSAK